jgi:hypothetical protein
LFELQKNFNQTKKNKTKINKLEVWDKSTIIPILFISSTTLIPNSESPSGGMELRRKEETEKTRNKQQKNCYFGVSQHEVDHGVLQLCVRVMYLTPDL